MRTFVIVLSIGAIIVLSGKVCADGTASPRIQLDNGLAKCVSIELGHEVTEKNLLLLPAKIGIPQSTGDCGCKSGAIRYRAFETYLGKRREINNGLLNSVPRSGKTDEVLLVLSTDTEIRRRPPFTVEVNCGG